MSETNIKSRALATVIGKPLDRKDAPLKVTGAATYAAEFAVQNPAYAVLVESEIAKGRIRAVDTSAAKAAAGVLQIFTHLNMPKLTMPKPDALASAGTAPGENRLPLADANISYAGQHVGLVVAETYEQARHAASLVKFDYETEKPEMVIEENRSRATQPKKFFGSEDMQIKRGGDARTALANAPVKVEAKYSTPIEHHHPMEPHATVAVWENNDLTLYDATQAVVGSQKYFAAVFGLPEKNVRVVAQYLGGGFGCKGLVWGHPILAAVAARELKRPVKLVLMRQQMKTSVGHRGRTVQHFNVGADKIGKIQSIVHESDTYTSFVGDFSEPSGLTTRLLYDTPALEVVHNVIQLNYGTPTPMRAPGESPGMFAMESALDELAHELKIDPIELRVTNYAKVNPHNGKPWSSKHLDECYRTGAEKFGWQNRKQPGKNQNGKYLIGYGMATASYPGYRSPASARVRIMSDGTAIVASATQDIGTGTYTVLMQVAAEYLGLPVERIKVEIGDSRLPVAPTSGGSQTVASVAPAVKQACEAAQKQIIALAIADKNSPLFNRKPEEIQIGDGGRIFVGNDSSRGETYFDVMKRANKPMIEGCVTAMIATPEAQNEPRNPAVKESAENTSQGQSGAGSPPCSPAKDGEANADQQKFAFQSFGAQFAEVRVDQDLGTVRVSRFVSVHDIGRVMNEKTCRSQVYSGVIYGIGMALMEETLYDHRSGRPVTRALADYHVPSHLDVPQVEVYLINKPDPHINALGARGIGEIGITGVPAAIANAVFNATGKRVRDLPITPDKLL